DFVQQVERAGDVGIDHPHDVGEVLVEKRLPQTAPGIGEKRVDRAVEPFQREVELFDTGQRREIDLDRLDSRAEPAEIGGRLLDLRLVGGNQQVEPVLGAAAGQL